MTDHTYHFKRSQDEWQSLQPIFDEFFGSFSFSTPKSKDESITVTIYPDDDERPIETRLALCCQFAQQAVPDKLQQIALPDIDWLAESFAQFKPLLLDGFWIYGSHHNPDDCPKGMIAMKIDASHAFGTGAHATTAGCVTALDKYLDITKHKSLLDVGCGSAILSMVAVKKGIKKVIASDIDAASVKIAQENCAHNKCAEAITVLHADGLNHPGIVATAPYDLTIANILAEPLIDLSADITHHTSKDGLIILSGLLQTQEEMIAKTYSVYGWHICARYPIDEWQTLVFKYNAGDKT